MNKLYITALLSVIILSSCNLLKKSNTDNNSSNNISLSEKELIKKINSQNISPEWTSLNSKIKVNKEGQEVTINAHIRIKKDSIIWISVKAPLGIEIFRTMITSDSVYYMNRMNKNYFIKHISHIREVVKTDVSFIKLQEIIFASPNITVLNSNKENYEILKDIFRVYKMELQEEEDKKVSIRYSDYKVFSDIGGLYFPEKIFIDVKSEEVFTAEINYTKIKFNKTASISFKIPKSYVSIN
ncbi:MAG: DUF4292 domain-containing protein [Flavobacteriales bacterium]|jgi:hypothetical protein|nr:DUF4292 domain-containing protein [Flavobacteriales bacterium]